MKLKATTPEEIFNKVEDKEGYAYVKNEIIDRVSALYVDCPECETIIHDDEQYQCGTCGGGGRINVLDWVKNQIKNNTQK